LFHIILIINPKFTQAAFFLIEGIEIINSNGGNPKDKDSPVLGDQWQCDANQNTCQVLGMAYDTVNTTIYQFGCMDVAFAFNLSFLRKV
jgi:hypothetical protein